jgi:hypothetical protein
MTHDDWLFAQGVISGVLVSVLFWLRFRGEAK